MLLGRVIGSLVACCVYEGLEGVPLLLVQPLGASGEPEGRTFVAADATRMAGPGELIYWESGREAALALDPWFVPVDHAIIGIVDDLRHASSVPAPDPPKAASPAPRAGGVAAPNEGGTRGKAGRGGRR
jgi:ethanolamine utilization protein EutN